VLDAKRTFVVHEASGMVAATVEVVEVLTWDVVGIAAPAPDGADHDGRAQSTSAVAAETRTEP
jgi:hypothetical protein